jgi:hypothetical protein
VSQRGAFRGNFRTFIRRYRGGGFHASLAVRTNRGNRIGVTESESQRKDSGKKLLQHQTKSVVVQAVLRRVVEAVRTTNVVRFQARGAATQHAKRPGAWTARIPERGRGVIAFPVAAPFPHIAVHVAQTERVRQLLCYPVRIFLIDVPRVSIKPRVLLQVRLVISETEGRFGAAAAGVFPLGFRRQAIGLTFHVTQLFAERHSVGPAHVHRGLVVAFLDEGLSFPWFCTHDLFPLSLSHLGAAHVKRLAQSHLMLGFVVVTVFFTGR